MRYIIHNHQQICSYLYLSSGKTTPCWLTTSCLQLVPTTLVCWWVYCGDRQPRVEVCPVGTVGTQLPIITAETRGTAQLIDFTGIYSGMPLQVFKFFFYCAENGLGYESLIRVLTRSSLPSLIIFLARFTTREMYDSVLRITTHSQWP